MNKVSLENAQGVHVIISPMPIVLVVPDPDGKGVSTNYITGECALHGQPDWSIHYTRQHQGKAITSSYFRPWARV